MRLVAVLVAALLCVSLTAQTAIAAVLFYGEGSGHGVGLSQYGAKAMAIGGSNYQAILGRYFRGSTVQQAVTSSGALFVAIEDQPAWVGLLQNQSQISFQVERGSAELCFDELSTCVAAAAEGETWSFGPVGMGINACGFWKTTRPGQQDLVGPFGACVASARPLTEESTFRIPRKARSYRTGTLRFRSATTNSDLHLVFQTDLETYVRGLAEIPESWPVDSLKAQVVVSRSLAVWNLLEAGSEAAFDLARQQECHCNLQDDAQPQLFRGFTGESTHPNWVEATKMTAGEIVTVSSAVAYTPYFHSSAGWTENYQDVFGGDGVSHLVSVNDSPAISDLVDNPLRYWGRSVASRSVATLFGFSWVNDLEVVARNPTGTVQAVAISGIRSGRPEVDIVEGVDLQTKLGLRSAVFTIIIEPRFTDVPPTHQFAGEIAGLSELEITDGCTPLTFCPSLPVTREEMAAFLIRALGLEAPNNSADSFIDDNGSAFEQDIEALYASGITTGCSKTEFCPTDLVTRGEMAAFLVRAFDLPAGTANSFVDASGSFFEEDISALLASGITSGCDSTNYCPERVVSRQEMAAFLVRVLALS